MKQEEKKKIDWLKIALYFFIIIFIISTGVKTYWFVSSAMKVREEIWFAYTHPEFVEPVRAVYEASHKKADSDLKDILLGK